jgi:hypothetical protein
LALPASRERKHPYCERPEYARSGLLSLGGSVDDDQGVAVVEIEVA